MRSTNSARNVGEAGTTAPVAPKVVRPRHDARGGGRRRRQTSIVMGSVAAAAGVAVATVTSSFNVEEVPGLKQEILRRIPYTERLAVVREKVETAMSPENLAPLDNQVTSALWVIGGVAEDGPLADQISRYNDFAHQWAKARGQVAKQAQPAASTA